ncbi:MAG TPA: GGDEF domain-containing protein [Burkholderiales bacterium]|nr:GGDEF domain-containing protein [Burkholderiales bacterium]
MRAFAGLHRYLAGLTRARILAVAGCGVSIVGYVDYLTGYEVSVSIFYLGPVAVAAWYAGRWPGIAVAAICCVSWSITDFATGLEYSHPAIMFWDSIVRFGFFLATGLLLTALRASYVHQRHLAQTDALTKLYSRRAFHDRLEHDLALAQRYNSAITLAYLDLDNFKTLNDTHGHAEGDRVLQVTGRVLKNSVRNADTAARLGGDEFAVILPNTDSHGAQRVMANLTLELETAFTTSKFQVTCSIGVVTFLDPLMSVASAVAAADKRMYEAKCKSKGSVAFIVLGRTDQPGVATDALQSASRPA